MTRALLLLPIALLSLATAPLLAVCPTIHRSVVVRKQVAAVAVVTPVAIAVPTYGAGYSTGQTQQLDNDLLRQILDEIRALRQELRAQPTQGKTNINAQALVDSTCLQCHKADKADASGGGFVMAENDGKMSVLSLEQKDRIRRRVSNGTMPPAKSLNRPLAESERNALVDFLTQVKE